MSDEQLVVTSDKKKKISFFSAILIVIGGSVGAGIFLRSKSVLEQSGGNVFWSIFAWLLAAFAVITMAIALVEVASGRNDNLGMIGWNKAFNGLYIYKACKWFMTFLYLPFTYYFMPIYVIIQMQDAAGGFTGQGDLIQGAAGGNDWIIMMVLALLISAWFFFTAGLSAWLGNIQNWVVTSVKFIPLVIVIVLGFLFAGQNLSTKPEGSDVTNGQSLLNITWWNSNSTSLAGLSPVFGLFTSMAGIFFAFDGFYVTAGVQSEMAEPKKTPLALVIGLSAVTTIYVVIAVSMTIGANSGGFYNFDEPLGKLQAKWMFGLINMCISIGILGILNGFTMWATRFVEDLVKEGELWVPMSVYKKMLASKAPYVGTIYALILTIPVVVLFNVIGSLAYFSPSNGGGYNDPVDSEGNFAGYYGSEHFTNNLYFCDLMANWMAVIAFAFIMMSIFGALKNRKENWIKVEHGKHTQWAGTAAVVLVSLALIMYALDPYVSLGLISKQGAMHDSKGALSQEFIGNLVTCILLPVFVAFMFGMVPVEKAIVYSKQKKFAENIANASSKEEKVKWEELQAFNNLRIHSFETAR